MIIALGLFQISALVFYPVVRCSDAFADFADAVQPDSGLNSIW